MSAPVRQPLEPRMLTQRLQHLIPGARLGAEPTAPTQLYEILLRRAERWPAAIAVGGQEGLIWKTLDSRQLLELVDRLAEELAAEGVRAGDRVVLWVPNHWRTPVYLFALWKLGAIVAPFDREMNPGGGARIIAAIEPRLVLVGYGERPAWAREIEVMEWWEPGNRVAASGGAWARPDEPLATLMFTSGTTGTPKGCMIGHANLLSQLEALPERVPLDPSCRLASVLPLSHLLELTGLLYALDSGAAVHYVPSRRGPDVLRVLSEQRITHMVVVPQLLIMMGRGLEEQLAARLPGPLYRALNGLAPRLPLAARHWLFWMVHRKLGGCLRLLLSGGAALPPETHLLWERLGVRVVQGYGTSECSPVVSLATPDGRAPVGSVGRPLRGVEVKLDPSGELLVRGPNVMAGYWKDPVRTAEVLRDGWYATGDLAEIDPAGNIRIVGRAKDLIALPSGLKVWPEDVEEVLRGHPAVKDAAVLMVQTAGGGAVLYAYLLPAGLEAAQSDLAAIVAECNAHLAAHQRLASASWYPEPDFPRTSMLKIRRHLLLKPDVARAVRVECTLAADDPVGQAVAGVARVAALPPGTTLSQLDLDSLGLVELSAALEAKTGKVVAEGELRPEMTIEQVRALVASAPDLESGASRPAGGPERVTTELPDWPYTWGRICRRLLSLPISLLYRYAVTRTIVLGGEHLTGLSARTIFAGTHHSFPDMPLVRYALARSPSRRLASRLLVPIAAGGFGSGGIQLGRGLGLYPWYGILAFGLYPLRQQVERDVSLRGLARLAAAGNPVLIFPQGVHSRPEQERADDPRVRFHAGVVHLARAVGARVVPFGLAGTERLMPPDPVRLPGRNLAGVPISLQRGPLAIAFGAPLELGENESPQAFAARLQTVCYALTRQAEAALEQEKESAPTQPAAV